MANGVGVLQRTILSFLLLVGFKTSNKFSQPCPVVPMHYEANYLPPPNLESPGLTHSVYHKIHFEVK